MTAAWHARAHSRPVGQDNRAPGPRGVAAARRTAAGLAQRASLLGDLGKLILAREPLGPWWAREESQLGACRGHARESSPR